MSPKHEEWILSQHVARWLGVRTCTVAKWRSEGKGPAGWVRRSRTVVVYPRSAVEAWIAAQGETAADLPVAPMQKSA